MEKPKVVDQHPAHAIVHDSLGFDVHNELTTPSWATRTLFSPTPVTSYERDVRYVVVNGAGTLSYFNTAGRPAGIRVIETGTEGTIAAGTLHSYAPTDASMKIIENNANLVKQQVPDLD